MTPECRESRAPALSRPRWRRPTLSMRTIRSPSASSLGLLTPLSPAPLPAGERGMLRSIGFVRADEGGAVRGAQRARLPPGGLEARRQLGSQLGPDSHGPHPFLVVPVELARVRHLPLEARSVQAFGPLLDGQRPHMRGIAPPLDVMEDVTRSHRWGAIDEGGVAAGP